MYVFCQKSQQFGEGCLTCAWKPQHVLRHPLVQGATCFLTGLEARQCKKHCAAGRVAINQSELRGQRAHLRKFNQEAAADRQLGLLIVLLAWRVELERGRVHRINKLQLSNRTARHAYALHVTLNAAPSNHLQLAKTSLSEGTRAFVLR